MAALKHHHALITGAGSGIGATIARTLSVAGAKLTLAGRNQAALDRTATDLAHAATVVADITRPADCNAMVSAARAAHGPIDVVIANAGGAESAPFERLDMAHWQRMIDVNLTGAFATAQAAIADLCRPRAEPDTVRRLIFVASTAGLKGYAYVSAYCAAKHGVVGLAKALAMEFAARGVTVNAVCPGFTETPLLETAVANIVKATGRSEQAARQDLTKANPQGRFVTPQEVAATVAWLCTPGASAINGQAISVSGGEI